MMGGNAIGRLSLVFLPFDEVLCGGPNVLNVNKASMARGFINDSLIEVFISRNLGKSDLRVGMNKIKGGMKCF